MNGNSEGYFLYGFQTMQGITCAKGDVKLGFRRLHIRRFRERLWHVHRQTGSTMPILDLGAGG
ncbi:MAG: hypothetical protein U5J83_15775 [Bryobacterales bacterium]|nr:hypothetical protein [Bryobacterales bacterium]